MWRGCRETGTLAGDVKGAAQWKTVWWILEKLNPWCSNPPSGYTLTEQKPGSWRDICTLMFNAVLFTIEKRGKQHQCPSVDKRVKKLWRTQTVECYSALRRRKERKFSHMWTWIGGVQPAAHWPHAAQHKIVNLLKTFFFAHQFSLVFVYLMCGPSPHFFFQWGPESQAVGHPCRDEVWGHRVNPKWGKPVIKRNAYKWFLLYEVPEVITLSETERRKVAAQGWREGREGTCDSVSAEGQFLRRKSSGDLSTVTCVQLTRLYCLLTWWRMSFVPYFLTAIFKTSKGKMKMS